MTGVVGPSNGLLLESEALDQEVYQKAVGGYLEVSVVKGQDKVSLLPGAPGTAQARRTSRRSSVPPVATWCRSIRCGAQGRLITRLGDKMKTSLDLPPGPSLTPEEAQRVEAGISQMLESMGRRPEPVTGWWYSVQFPELGDTTIVEAWLHGDHDGVRQLVELLHARSRASAERVAQDPAFMEFLRDRMARLA